MQLYELEVTELATLNDVAKEAGVSPITVSRVMNDSPAVRPATRERVLEAVKKLNYQPNLLARSLSADRMDSIGVVVTHVENPMYSLMTSGIYSEAAEHGFDVILSCSHDLESSIKSVTTLLNKRVSGLVVLPVEFRVEKPRGGKSGSQNDVKMMEAFAESFGGIIARYAPSSFPVVTIGAQIEGGVSGRVIENYGGGAAMAVDCLVRHGHRRIGFVSHVDKTDGIWGERYRGFFQAMEKNKLPVEEKWIACCDENIDSARDAMLRILSQEERPTAVYCANDLIAAGAMNAAVESGLSIPEDISVIGHDGSSFGEMLRPPLSTVAIYPVEMGKQAVRLLLSVLRGGLGADMILTPQVIERGSVADCL